MKRSLAAALAVCCASGVITLVAAGSAQATLLGQCEGTFVSGQGGGLQGLAEASWTSEFNLSGTASACNGTQGSHGLPSVSYLTTTGKAALTAWEKKEEYG